MAYTRLNPVYVALYKPGDTISGICDTGGYVTGSGMSFVFSVPIKPVSGTLTLTKSKLTVRQNGNYLVGSGSGPSDVKQYTAFSKEADSLIFVNVTMPSAPSGVQNNSAIGVHFEYTFTVS